MSTDAEELPVFTYFPDPVGNGCIERKDAVCECCEQPRGFMYVGPIYAEEEFYEVCPWCIADRSAAEEWSASFNDDIGWSDAIPLSVLEEITTRTPGFSTWQGNRWLYGKDDAMVFLGEVTGKAIIAENDPNKIEACKKVLGDWNGDLLLDSLSQVVPSGRPAIYLFQDRRTGEFEAYSDTD